jgi:protein-S-isoprenylcysteine O-methyltransferase Ste14
VPQITWREASQVTAPTRDAAAVRIFPPALPLGAILLGVALQWAVPLDPGFTLAAPARWWLGGFVAAAAILGLGAYPVLLFRRVGQTENPWTPTHHVVERGPFRFTRNPMYLQMLLVCVAAAIAFWNPWILALTPLAGWALQRFAIEPEEAYLERKFGAAYLDYKRRVRRWL